jgi:hypothetical protein
MSILTTAFHYPDSRTKDMLLLTVPINRTGFLKMRLFTLDISVRADSGSCALDGLQPYQIFHTIGRPLVVSGQVPVGNV